MARFGDKLQIPAVPVVINDAPSSSVNPSIAGTPRVKRELVIAVGGEAMIHNARLTCHRRLSLFPVGLLELDDPCQASQYLPADPVP